MFLKWQIENLTQYANRIIFPFNKMLTIRTIRDIMGLLHNYIYLIICGKITLVKVRFPFFRFHRWKCNCVAALWEMHFSVHRISVHLFLYILSKSNKSFSNSIVCLLTNINFSFTIKCVDQQTTNDFRKGALIYDWR